MTRAEFAEALDRELSSRGVECALCDVLEFVGEVWPRIQTDKEVDISKWAARCIEWNQAGAAAPELQIGPGGAQPEAAEGRPWERPGVVRRDYEPHRGHWLVPLSGAAQLCGIASVALVLPALFSLPLGVLLFGLPWLSSLSLGLTVFTLARGDLGKMSAGLMDPAGRRDAVHARGRGLFAVAVSLAALLFAIGLFVAGRLF